MIAISKGPWQPDAGPRFAYVTDAEGRLIAAMAPGRPVAQQCADAVLTSVAPTMLRLVEPTLYALTEIIDRADVADLKALASLMELRGNWMLALQRATDVGAILSAAGQPSLFTIQKR